MSFDTLIPEIIEITNRDKKDLVATYAKLGEETGELAREVLAYVNEPSTLHRYSTKADIVEECIDTALVALSLAIKAGASESDLEKMFRAKLNKWGDILQREGRLKDITKIPFEIHLTVPNTSGIEKFQIACQEANVKLISLDLVTNSGGIHDLMTSSQFLGTNSEALEEINRITKILDHHGFNIIRSKIETVPWHPLAPQKWGDIQPEGCYFESHIGVFADTLEDIGNSGITLKEICDACQAHVSRNLMKKDQRSLQMLTLRKYTNRLYFTEYLDSLTASLDKYGFEYERPIVEFSLYDTKIHHDAEWLKKS